MTTLVEQSLDNQAPNEGLLRPALTLFLVLSIITGLAYPLLTTGIAQVVFPEQANGSLLKDAQGHIVGSALIGQSFSDPKYFWSRPSATGPMAYNAGASSGSNLGPVNPQLVDVVKARIVALRAADPDNTALVPVDLITASASGLDPHISRNAADYQMARVAKLRGLPEDKVRALIEANTEEVWLGIIGEAHVNVLNLNLALDAQLP